MSNQPVDVAEKRDRTLIVLASACQNASILLEKCQEQLSYIGELCRTIARWESNEAD